MENARQDQPERALFVKELAPRVSQLSTKELADATGLSEHYCSLIRLGKRTPHPRHWDALRKSVAATLQAARDH